MISSLNFKYRSLLFARLAGIAYLDKVTAIKQAKELGFTDIEFYDRDGAQAFRFENNEDIVIACRGTQPTQWNDVKADLRAIPVMAETVGRVHLGFKAEVDDLWPLVKQDLAASYTKKIWFCGHSLGAAMATIMAARCNLNPNMPDIEEIYTYGSPRVGWSKYVKSLEVPHHRWVNNNDIVTRVPLTIMGYRHHGTEHYMNSYGNIRPMTRWQRIKDRFRGMRAGIKKRDIDSFSDHLITNYIANLETYARNMEFLQR
jgi:triacylglycerol lipase